MMMYKVPRPLFLHTTAKQAAKVWACVAKEDNDWVRPKECIPGVPKKADPLGYFDDNFGKYGPILIIFSLLQREIHDAQN